MEVKSIFVNLIMKTYERQGPHHASQMHTEKTGNVIISDNVSISQNSSKRLFEDLMEHSLQKGLCEVIPDEN
ncbi:MAG TPA: hypothetical protein ENN05_01835 [Deltaproteobacteria bacterium]|nr:hypothetical protein [Deltaproteobacteria bacterium]